MQSAKVYLEVSPRNQYEIFNKGAYHATMVIAVLTLHVYAPNIVIFF
jgi:hypothetical protein